MADPRSPASRSLPAFAALSADRQLVFLIAVNLVVIIAATAMSEGRFLSLDNFQSMGAQMAELGLLAIGVSLTMISGNGGIDLSGAALANLSGVVAALIAPHLASPDDSPLLFTAVFAGVAVLTGLVGGLVNGLLIARAGLTPILATLGTQLFFTGTAVALTNGATVRVAYVDQLAAIGNDMVLGVPIGFALFLAAIVVVGIVLARTRYGLQLYLMGTNPKAARFAGIPQSRMLVTTYAISGVLASVAGVIIASRTSSVKWDYGSSYLLITILIAVMAGIRPQGGYGRMICVFFSATALQVLSSAFNLMGISNFFRDCAWGILLLVFLAVSAHEPKVRDARSNARAVGGPSP